MIDFKEWLAEFAKGKELLATIEQSTTDAIHGIRRYKDTKGCVWEVAQTYTGRVVARSGIIEADGDKVRWGKWSTERNVSVGHSR